MTHATELSSRKFMRLQGMLLALRCLVISFIGIIAYNFDLPFFVISLMGIAALALWLIKTDLICRLPYCFLLTSAIWAGVSMALTVTHGDPIAVVFGLSLALLDGSIFVSTWRRSWL